MDAAGLAQRLVVARNARGWSQERLAEESGIARRTIAALEGQEHTGHFATVEHLADVLQVSLDWLAWDLGEMIRRVFP